MTVQDWALTRGKWVVIKPAPKTSGGTDDLDDASAHSEDDQMAESPGKPSGTKRGMAETLAQVRSRVYGKCTATMRQHVCTTLD